MRDSIININFSNAVKQAERLESVLSLSPLLYGQCGYDRRGGVFRKRGRSEAGFAFSRRGGDGAAFLKTKQAGESARFL